MAGQSPLPYLGACEGSSGVAEREGKGRGAADEVEETYLKSELHNL